MSQLVVTLPTLHHDQVRAYRTYQRHPRFVLRAGRRWGKTEFLKTVGGDVAVNGYPVGWFTPDYKISSEAFNEIATMLAPVKASSSKVDGVIRTVTGGRIDFWTLDNERAGRSRKYKLVVFDEVAFNKKNVREIWERSIEPTLLDMGGRAIFASNTNGKDPDNFLYQLHQECGNDGGTKRDGYGEFHAPTRNNPHVPERQPGETEESHAKRRLEAIEKIRANNHPLVFKQEYEAEFVNWDGVAFFDKEKLLELGQPIPFPRSCGGVYATVDTATKTGNERDGTAVCYWAITPPGEGPYPLILLDWDLVQIEGALLETWLPTVFQNLEMYAQQTRARAGAMGTWIEDKSSGMVLLQHAANKGWPARGIDSKLTAMGKSERAISVSGYVYQGKVKFSRHAYEKVVVYKNASRNHVLDQVLAFRVGEDQRDKQDDGLDAFVYGIAVGLGNAGGF